MKHLLCKQCVFRQQNKQLMCPMDTEIDCVRQLFLTVIEKWENQQMNP